MSRNLISTFSFFASSVNSKVGQDTGGLIKQDQKWRYALQSDLDTIDREFKLGDELKKCRAEQQKVALAFQEKTLLESTETLRRLEMLEGRMDAYEDRQRIFEKNLEEVSGVHQYMFSACLCRILEFLTHIPAH